MGSPEWFNQPRGLKIQSTPTSNIEVLKYPERDGIMARYLFNRKSTNYFFQSSIPKTHKLLNGVN
jgi:hypothetical protein